MRTLAAILLLILTAVAKAASDELVWQACLQQHTPAESPHYSAWLIVAGAFPAVGPYKPIAAPAGFESTLDTIFATDKNPRISAIALGNVSEMDGLREQVITYLVEMGALEPATEDKPLRWKLRNGAQGRMQALRDAILRSEFVQSLDRVLRRHNKQVSGLQMEKVLFAFDKKPPNWLAMLWLDVDK